jgi:hypothetical protein
MKCDSWASLLAHTLASPCLGCEPKAKVATYGVSPSFPNNNYNNNLLNVNIRHDHTHFLQLGQKIAMLLCILNMSSLKEFIKPLIVFLHPCFWLLFDGIQFDLNVINMYIVIFLHYPCV